MTSLERMRLNFRSMSKAAAEERSCLKRLINEVDGLSLDSLRRHMQKAKQLDN